MIRILYTYNNNAKYRGLSRSAACTCRSHRSRLLLLFALREPVAYLLYITLYKWYITVRSRMLCTHDDDIVLLCIKMVYYYYYIWFRGFTDFRRLATEPMDDGWQVVVATRRAAYVVQLTLSSVESERHARRLGI